MSRRYHRTLRALGIAVSVVCATASCDAELMSPEFERVMAERAAADFVSQHRDAFRVSVRGTDAPAVLEQSSACGAPGGSGLNALVLTGRDAQISLYLDCAVAPGASAAELSAALAFVVINELPHGITAPGWRFWLLTPSSSFTDGVTLAVAGGRLTVDIDTPLFAVSGYSERPSCETPLDAMAKPECYLQRPFDVPLHLTFSVPYPQ